MTFLKKPVVAATAIVAVLWCLAWVAIAPHFYGWLTGDAVTFDAMERTSRTGASLFDPTASSLLYPIFGAIPLKFHLALPSGLVPRLWTFVGMFRLIAISVAIAHAGVLIAAAYLYSRISREPLVTIVALVLFALSPTLWMLSSTLDTSFFAFVPVAIAIAILLPFSVGPKRSSKDRSTLLSFAVAGVLFAAGVVLNQCSIYLSIPFAVAYAAVVFSQSHELKEDRVLAAAGAGAFMLAMGIAELFSLAYHPFSESFLVQLFASPTNHLSPWARLVDAGDWTLEFVSQMGALQVLAVVGGAAALLRKSWRPSYVADAAGLVLGWTFAGAAIYVALFETRPYYQFTADMQPVFALLAAIGVERAASLLAKRFPKATPAVVVAVAAVALAIVPAIRSGEVISGSQGLGHIVSWLKHNGGDYRFITTYDWDRNAASIGDKHAFDALPDSTYVVTNYPLAYFAKYPDFIAAAHDTAPVAAFPTLWCSHEAYVETKAYFANRRWFDEPELCQARIYRVGDLRAKMGGEPLTISKVFADSTNPGSQPPGRVFQPRDPKGPFSDIYADERLTSDVWASEHSPFWHYDPTPPAHWLQVNFARPISVSSITVVSPDFTYVGRVRSMDIYGGTPTKGTLLWHGDHLGTDLAFDVTFPATTVSALRFIIQSQGDDPLDRIGALAYVKIDGYAYDYKPSTP